MLAVALLTYAAFRVAPLPQHLSEGFAQSVYTLLLVLAAAATALATARSEGYERGFWGRFTIMLVALTLAQLMWTWSAFRLPGFPVDVFAFDMVAEIVAMGVFISLVWTMTDVADGTTLGKLRYFIDVVAAALIAGVLLYTVVIYPWFASYGTSGWITVGYALYPVFGILVGLWTLSNLFGFRPSGWTSWERPAVAGLILFLSLIHISEPTRPY